MEAGGLIRRPWQLSEWEATKNREEIEKEKTSRASQDPGGVGVGGVLIPVGLLFMPNQNGGDLKVIATFYHTQPVLCPDEQTILLIKSAAIVSSKYSSSQEVGQKLGGGERERENTVEKEKKGKLINCKFLFCCTYLFFCLSGNHFSLSGNCTPTQFQRFTVLVGLSIKTNLC